MNFKVKCTGVHEGNPRFTNGKIYEVRNGKLFADKSVRYEAWAKPINGNGDFEALRKWFKNYYDFELVEEHKTKYKAGDKVIASDNLGIFKSAVGVITDLWYRPDHPTPYFVEYPDYHGKPVKLWSSVERLADVIDDKIVITHDGKTTTATMYCADGTKKVATARCAPDDKFDFEFGAKLAMDRLMEYIENSKYTVVEVSFKSGRTNYHYKTKDSAAKVGMKIFVPVGGNNREIEATITNVVPGSAYIGTFPMSEMKEIEIKEVQLYNGKVVCIDPRSNHCYTKGKIYQFNDGVLTADDGFKMDNSGSKCRSFADWEKFSSANWIEIVE